MKRLLFVSIASPPKSGPESLQVGKYIRGLSNHFDIDLVTTKAANYGWSKASGKIDDLLLPYIKSRLELNSYNSRLAYRIKSWLPNQLRVPDNSFHFHKSSGYVLKRLKKIPDIIYSRSAPFSSSILALKIKEEINKPWVMHMSDPWTDSPFLTSNLERNKDWEKACISKADIVTVTNEGYRRLLKIKYPDYSFKFKLSYNVYETLDFKPVDLNQQLSLIFFGNFYGKRNPEVFLEPLSRAYAESPNAFRKVNVIFYGNIGHSSQKVLDEYNLPFVQHKGYISPANIPQALEDASILVNIEDRFSEIDEILFLPSKIMDYISYQKLILSIASSQSPSTPIIKNKYGYVYEHDDIVGIVRFLKNAIEAHLEKNESFFKVQQPDPLFSAETQTKKLKNMILSVL